MLDDKPLPKTYLSKSGAKAGLRMINPVPRVSHTVPVNGCKLACSALQGSGLLESWQAADGSAIRTVPGERSQTKVVLIDNKRPSHLEQFPLDSILVATLSSTSLNR